MPTQVDQREIEIDHRDAVASAAAQAVGETHEPGERIQHISGDIEGMSAEVLANPPWEVLNAVRDELAASDPDEYPDVPNDPDRFGVVAVDITVDERSTVTIEVYD